MGRSLGRSFCDMGRHMQYARFGRHKSGIVTSEHRQRGLPNIFLRIVAPNQKMLTTWTTSDFQQLHIPELKLQVQYIQTTQKNKTGSFFN